MTNGSEQYERVAKALADPQRFAIFEHICRGARERGEVGCKAIVARFPVSQATISHHLKELQNAGLIDGRRKGQCLLLAPRHGTLRAYVSYLQDHLLDSAVGSASADLGTNHRTNLGPSLETT